jgi:N-acylneuraminate cytidylyltransferase
VKVAVIPARGGSKRIPRKNIRPFAGKPMIAHSIGCALRSGLFDRVIVSTDDDEIADIARRFGAEAPFRRPAELSGDHAGTAEVVAHAVRWLRNDGSEVTVACCIYPAAPFIREGDLAAALAKLEGGGWQFVFSATTCGFPIFRSFHMNAEEGVEMFYPEHFSTRSQDLPEALHDAGQFYWGRPEAWLNTERFFDKHSTVLTIPRWRVQDIDTLEDWGRAETMLRLLQRAGASE